MTQPTGSNPAQKIPVSIQDEMRTSYLDYAMSVIIGRAIPDVRDGLKPVHRRILYSAYEQGLMPTAGVPKERHDRRRRARQVPPARRRQSSTTRWSASPRTSRCATRSSTGRATSARSTATPPAAYRYTEARLSASPSSSSPTSTRSASTSPRTSTTRRKEPRRPAGAGARTCSSTAPAASPSAWRPTSRRTTWARSSTRRSTSCARPTRPIDDLMRFVPGPDFPTGGPHLRARRHRAAYRTGRGSIIMRARCGGREVARAAASSEQIVVTEIPYQVNKARVHAKHRRADAREEDRGHRRGARRERPRRHAPRHRAEEET